MGNKQGEIVLYRAPDKRAKLEVRLQQETVWLTQAQMAKLFSKERSVITRHLRNIFKEKEIDEKSNVQKMHFAGSSKPVALYSLDAIISVGYRVNSKQGIQFRIWATRILREHLVKGYTANEHRLKELRTSIQLVQRVIDRLEVSSDEARALLSVISDYARALDLLDDFDHGLVSTPDVLEKPAIGISYDDARRIIERLRQKFGGSELFGREKDESLHGSLSAVMQSYSGKDLYPSLEAKAAHLPYFLVKNHSFVDGNKRIAASLENRALYRADGTKRIADNALVALAIMVAASDPAEKNDIVGLLRLSPRAASSLRDR